MSNITEQPIYETFDPVKLGKKLRIKRNAGNKHFVTILLGAGCSKSAGIPLAGEIVQEIRAEDDPLLEGIGAPPQGVSEYAFLMSKLGTPKERAEHIKEYVDRAKDKQGRVRINWTHLLLATMVEHEYIYHILTTNFDPLIVDALAIMGQPIRTFDLNTTGNYYPGTLDTASIIYLHGQVHSLFLANTKDEMQKIGKLYQPVLQEAIQDSYLIVLGYSGDCDPVLDLLKDLPKFPRGLWWSNYSGEIGAGVKEIFKKHGSDCHLTEGLTADLFMKKLVVDGMSLDYPDEVVTPITAARKALARITGFPIIDIKEPDPVAASREFLNEVERQIPESEKMKESQRVIQIEMAASKGDWKEFENLSKDVPKNPDLHLSQAIGDSYVQRIWQSTEKESFGNKLLWVNEAKEFGQSLRNKPWLQIAWGNVLSDQAKMKGNTPEGDALFAEAEKKFSNAVRIKSDMHEAFNNWGTALVAQARLKDKTPEGDQLFVEAGKKYEEAIKIKPDKYGAFFNWGNALMSQAKMKGNTPEGDALFAEAEKKFSNTVRIKSDMHEAFNNWGNALMSQAKMKGNTPEGDRLFDEAGKKYAEALRIKPDKHEAFNNWGTALSDQAKLKGNTPEGDRLFDEAGKKYAEAVRFKPDKYEIFYNWGNSLTSQARLKGNTPEGDKLFVEVGKKYAEAIRINPENYEAFNKWGTALLAQARLKDNTSEADQLFIEAGKKYAEVIRFNPEYISAYYNMACLYSFKNDVIRAIANLELWLKYAPNARIEKIDNDSDFNNIRETEEFKKFKEKLKD
jgi:cytochrome c-type biogenesis protein CcmH/NrfG